MKKDNLYFSEDSRPAIINGVRKIARAVGCTMGTGGQNSVLERFESPGFMLTNDGWSILDSIKLADPLEEMGRSFLREATSRANKNSGDGSSTTCVLTAAILEEGMKHLSEATPMEIKRSMENCIPLIVEQLESGKKDITPEDVHKVAAISAEDEEIGNRIGEIYQKIGKDGIIQWEASRLPKDDYTLGNGLLMEDAGWITPYLNDIDQQNGRVLMEASAKNVPVLMVKDKITNGTAFNSIFLELYNQGNSDVVVFCDEITPDAVGSFVQTRAQRGFRVILVKMPVLWGDEWWEDVAIASGAKIISKQTGISLSSLKSEDIGRLGNIVVKRDSVYMDGLQDMEKHILGLKVDGSDAAMLRVARLNTKTARYLVGGYSDSAISYRRLKVEDAINAASEALDGGVLAGGGVALANVELPEGSVGAKILNVALKAPMNTILKNANLPEGIVIEKGKGVDTRTLQVVDMFDAGIIDPKKVVENAMKAAISVASGILTHGTVVLFPEQEAPKEAPPSLLTR